ncbi:MAG: hypothetical protein JW874_00465, partial [Spirochaetales bacterium]|nr:hypothetical protein [Spirochaetales bacterium]
MIDNNQIETILPLDPMQEGILFHHLLAEDDDLYVVQTKLNIQGPIDIDVLGLIFQKLVDKYQILRTVIVYENLRKPMQIVLKKRDANIRFHDISAFNTAKKEKFIVDFLANDRKEGFDLAKDILLRCTVIKLEESSYLMVMTDHHIILDGWCAGIMMGTLFRFYRDHMQGEKIDTAEQYKFSDYIKWVRNQDKNEAKTFWLEYLSGYEEISSIPAIISENRHAYSLNTYYRNIGPEMISRIDEISRKYDITKNVIMRVAWALLLSIYSGKNDVVFGSVSSGRPEEIEGVDQIVGVFIKTLPSRVLFNGMDTVLDLFYVQKECILITKKYEYFSYPEIQRNLSRKEKLLDHLFSFQNFPRQIINNLVNTDNPDIRINNLEMTEQSTFDLNILILPDPDLIVEFSYNKNRYPDEFISILAENYLQLIEMMLKDPEQKISNVYHIGFQDENRILNEFNDTATDYPREKSVADLFEAEVEKDG